jgi:ABC-type phosphate transport system substrate-binding protein
MNNSLHRLLIAGAALLSSAVAHAEISIVVHPDHPLASMTTEQIAAIYLGKDQRFQPIDLPESERLHHWFYYKTTGRDAVQIRIHRARHLASAVPPRVATNSVDAIRRVAANKRAIAYVDSSAVDSSVKVIMKIQNPELLDSLRANDE